MGKDIKALQLSDFHEFTYNSEVWREQSKENLRKKSLTSNKKSWRDIACLALAQIVTRIFDVTSFMGGKVGI